MLTERTAGGVRLVVDDDAGNHGVLVAFSDRIGGVSRVPYDTLNLAARVGDDSADVDANRRRVAAAAGFEPPALVLARQVHGTGVIEAGPGDAGVIGDADILVTRAPGRVLAILSADCVPVVLQGDGVVAVVHAGWRGLVGGAIETGIAALGSVTRAWVGPSIHACCYEVGPEVVAAFEAAGLPIAADDRVDPGRAAIVALRRGGIDGIEAITDCTSCDARYFSYRRDGVTGRQGSFVGLLQRP
jgi:YfiH family protein